MEIDSRYDYVQSYIGVPVAADIFKEFPPTVDWEGATLLKEDNFHVTICCGQDIFTEVQMKSGVTPEETEVKLLSLFNDFVENTPLDLSSVINDFRYIQDNARGRKSIVVRCHLTNLKEFFERMNSALGVAMPVQPAYVTVYTLQKNLGIHVPSEAVMNSLPPVRLPALEEGFKSIDRVS